jgi:hypothetical protein
MVAERPARKSVLAQSSFMTKLIEAIENLDGQLSNATYTLDDLMSRLTLEDELRMELAKVLFFKGAFD